MSGIGDGARVKRVSVLVTYNHRPPNTAAGCRSRSPGHLNQDSVVSKSVAVITQSSTRTHHPRAEQRPHMLMRSNAGDVTLISGLIEITRRAKCSQAVIAAFTALPRSVSELLVMSVGLQPGGTNLFFDARLESTCATTYHRYFSYKRNRVPAIS